MSVTLQNKVEHIDYKTFKSLNWGAINLEPRLQIGRQITKLSELWDGSVKIRFVWACFGAKYSS